MKSLIKKILKEEMLSQLNNWEDNISELDNKNIITTLIGKDDENGDKLYLFVGFNTKNNITEYSYSFILVDKENNPISGYETERSVVRKLLPKDIVGKQKIIPVVKELTRRLLDNTLPIEIYRRTSEKLKDNNSLQRYEIITDIMVNEYGYELVNRYVDEYGYTIWKLRKNDNIHGNMKNEYHINIDDIGVLNEVHSFRNIDFNLLKY
jgi:hypothetical protein